MQGFGKRRSGQDEILQKETVEGTLPIQVPVGVEKIGREHPVPSGVAVDYKIAEQKRCQAQQAAVQGVTPTFLDQDVDEKRWQEKQAVPLPGDG